MSDHRRDTWAAYGSMGSSLQGRPQPHARGPRRPQPMPYAAELGHRRPVRWVPCRAHRRPTRADLRERATVALQRLAGRDEVDFRDGQLEAIEALVESRRRVLVVQRTGWGKSAVYFVATALRRAEGAGPTVIVSPLLALMRDQIAAAERAGSARSRSTRRTPTSGCGLGSALAGRGGRAPREPGTPEQPALSRRAAPGPRVVVRPARRRRGALHQRLGARLPSRLPADPGPAHHVARRDTVLATTATANARVVTDVVEQLSAGGSVATARAAGTC